MRTELDRLEQVYAAFEAWYAEVKTDNKKQAYIDDNWNSLVETALEHFESGWEYSKNNEESESEEEEEEEDCSDCEECGVKKWDECKEDCAYQARRRDEEEQPEPQTEGEKAHQRVWNAQMESFTKQFLAI